MASPPPFWPINLLDQDFGMCITPHDCIMPCYNTYGSNYYRPWKWGMQNVRKEFGSTIENEKEKLKIMLDVQQFQPNEITVKVKDREIVIEGKHEERQDAHGFISRRFSRRYALPSDCSSEDVISTLSSDGVLTVIAIKKSIKDKSNESVVPIQYCGSCPYLIQRQSASASQTDQKTTSDMKKVAEDDKIKLSQIMLKEDHCCLLKPELLEKSVKGTGERTATKIESEMLKMTSDKIGETLVASSDINETLEKSKFAMSELTEKNNKSCMAASSEAMEKSSSTMAAEMAEKFGQSSTTSEISSIKSTSCETSETAISSSYKSSMSSSMKVSSETSEFLSDISAELGEAADNI